MVVVVVVGGGVVVVVGGGAVVGGTTAPGAAGGAGAGGGAGGAVVVVVAGGLGIVGGGTGWARTATSTVTDRPWITRLAASTMHPPAAVVYPDLMPTTLLEPISVTTFGMVPTSGRVTDRRPTTRANVGSLIPAAATRRQSAAVETVWGSYPLAST